MDENTCMVEVARFFMSFTQRESCGKCVPCRIGLGVLEDMLEDVLDGKATLETLSLIERTAKAIYDSADCAIGYEAGRMVLKGLEGFREDFIEHITNGHCSCHLEQPVPCVALCPAGVDVPGYISLIADERYADAVKLIRKDNPFVTSCALVCEHPCETKCRRNFVDDAVNIRGLKRYAADHCGLVPPPECCEPTGKTVAIIGGGPSGLSAAYYLQLMGHQTTVFEMLPKLGGMLRYGIPSFKLEKDVIDAEIDIIKAMGVEIKCGVEVGKDVTIIILTSNLGSDIILNDLEQRRAQGSNELSEDAKHQIDLLLKSKFRPEFLNRLDEIVYYKSLTKDEMRKIVDLQLADLRSRMDEGKHLNLDVTTAAKDYIIDSAYDSVYGARPIKRFIQSRVETLIAKAIIQGSYAEGSTLTVDYDGNALVLK